MANLTTGYGGAITPDATENVDVPADLLQLANSLDAKVLGVFASTAARDAAKATANAAAAKCVCYITGQGVQIYNGTNWEWVGRHAPVQFTFGVGGSGVLSGNPGFSQWTTANYSFTATATEYAQIYADFDVQSVASGFGFAFARIKLAINFGPLIQIDQFNIIHEAQARHWVRFPIVTTQKLIAGQNALLIVEVGTTFAAGQWQLNAMTWNVLQQ